MVDSETGKMLHTYRRIWCMYRVMEDLQLLDETAKDSFFSINLIWIIKVHEHAANIKEDKV